MIAAWDALCERLGLPRVAGVFREETRRSPLTRGGGVAFTAAMRVLVHVVMCAVLVLLASCARTQPGGDRAKPAPVFTPDTTLRGRVVHVNATGRYVVLNFPVGRLPSPAQSLGVYRKGLKVGEVRIDDRWRRDDNIVADLTVGEAQVGDDVSDR